MARAAGGPALNLRWVGAAIAIVLRHPSLWWIGLRQAIVLAPSGWWRRPPFLPLPAREYMRFRMETAYGGAGDGPPAPEDLLTYLRWCRDFPA